MSVTPLEINDRQGLAAFLAGRTRSEIEDIATEVGVSDVLARIFGVMQRDFAVENAPGDVVRVQWIVTDPARVHHTWFTEARPDGCTCGEGEVEGDIVLRLGLVTFLEIMAGRLKGMKALSTGRLKLKGDLILATSIEKWFGVG